MYQDSQFYVLRLSVLCIGSISFIYCSYESEYSGLSPVMIKSYFLVDITMTPLPPR